MARSQVQYGSQGNDVKELQKILNQNGYKLTEDGIFGDNTLNAVRDYQKKNGLSVDGIVGTNTWGALSGGSNPTTPTTNTSPTTDTNGFNYDNFSYDAYQESDIVTQTKDALNAQLSQKPGEYNSQWQAQLDDVINKIMNREKFSYDLNGDALYQQYKDKYVQQGKMASADVMGQAAAMTGGYGNSYAQSVGQQAYQAQLQNLNDIVPELYQMAYDKYNQEGQDLYNQYAMLGAQEEQDYGRYKDSVSDWQAERDYLTGRYDTERGLDYSKYTDDRNFAYGEHRDSIADQQWQDAFDYQKEQDQIANKQWQDSFDWQKSEATTNRTESNAKDFHTTGGKVGYDNGSVSTDNIKLMQKALGVSADGKWGAGSTEAAGGLTADQAWKAYQDGKLGKADVSYNDVKEDCDYFISQGAAKSEIGNYLREALQSGYITQDEYNKLKEIYVPRGYTYGTGGGGGGKDLTVENK